MARGMHHDRVLFFPERGRDVVVDQRRRSEKLGARQIRGRKEACVLQRRLAFAAQGGRGLRQAHAGKRFPDPQRQHMVLRFAAVEAGGEASVGHCVAQTQNEIICAAPAQPQGAILFRHLQGAGQRKAHPACVKPAKRRRREQRVTLARGAKQPAFQTRQGLALTIGQPHVYCRNRCRTHRKLLNQRLARRDCHQFSDRIPGQCPHRARIAERIKEIFDRFQVFFQRHIFTPQNRSGQSRASGILFGALQSFHEQLDNIRRQFRGVVRIEIKAWQAADMIWQCNRFSTAGLFGDDRQRRIADCQHFLALWAIHLDAGNRVALNGIADAILQTLLNQNDRTHTFATSKQGRLRQESRMEKPKKRQWHKYGAQRGSGYRWAYGLAALISR